MSDDYEDKDPYSFPYMFGFNDERFPNFFRSSDDDEDVIFSIFPGTYSDEDDKNEDIFLTASRIFYILFFVALAIMLVFFYALYKFVPILISQVWQETEWSLSRLILLIFILIVSGGLFWLRDKRRVIYGMLELTFAVISAWVSIGLVISNVEQVSVLIASIYLLVRSYDNLKVGFSQFDK